MPKYQEPPENVFCPQCQVAYPTLDHVVSYGTAHVEALSHKDKKGLRLAKTINVQCPECECALVLLLDTLDDDGDNGDVASFCLE